MCLIQTFWFLSKDSFASTLLFLAYFQAVCFWWPFFPCDKTCSFYQDVNYVCVMYKYMLVLGIIFFIWCEFWLSNTISRLTVIEYNMNIYILYLDLIVKDSIEYIIFFILLLGYPEISLTFASRHTLRFFSRMLYNRDFKSQQSK